MSNARGQSIVEILIGIAIGAVLIASASTIILGSLRVTTTTTTIQAKTEIGKELADNIKAWAAVDWHNVINVATGSANTYYIDTSLAPFMALPGTETVTIGSTSYQRSFYVSDLYRDSSGNVTTTASGNTFDPSTKQISVSVNTASVVTDGSFGAWATTTPLNHATFGSYAAFYGGYVYLPGGENIGGASISNVQFARIKSDGSLSSWTDTTALPTPISQAAVIAYKRYLYVISGVNGSSNTVTTTYYANLNQNGTLGTWQTTTAFPGAGLRGTTVAANNGYIYVIAGSDSTGATVTTTVNFAPINSDGSLGSWATTTPSLKSGRKIGVATIYNNNLYSEFGSDGPLPYTSFGSSGTLNAWAWLGNSTNAIQTTTEGGIIQSGFVYEMGMPEASTKPTSSVTYAKIQSSGNLGTWYLGNPLLYVINSPIIASYNNALYSFGGEVSSTLAATTTVLYTPLTSTPAGASTTFSFYLTHSANNSFAQTDWSGGSGVSGPLTLATNTFSSATNSTYSSAGAISITSSSTMISFVQAQVNDASGGTSTVSITTTAGNLLVMVCGQGSNSTTVASANDSAGQTWTQLGNSIVNAAGFGIETMFYKANSASVASTSCSWGSPITTDNTTYEISGAATSSPADSGTPNPATSTTVANNSVQSLVSAALTTTNANDILLYGLVTGGSSGGFSAGSGFILPGGANSTSSGVSYKIVTSTQTGATTTMTWVTTRQHDIGIFGAFKAGGGVTVTYPATSTLDSITFDTGSPNGAQLNSIVWQGTQPSGTSVQFQIATSNATSGPWTYGTLYSPSGPGTAVSIGIAQGSGARYFRYRITLNANAAKTLTPTVNTVSVNWSP